MIGCWLLVFGCWCLVILLSGCFVVWLSGCFVVCLEDSTPLLCSFAFGSVRTRSKGSRIKPMRRILSFHGFNFVLLLGIGFTTDCICAFTALDNPQQELIRDNPSARQAQRNPTRQ